MTNIKTNKIAIDITAITSARGNFGDKSGVYRYTLDLITNLAEIIKPNDSYQLYLLDFVGTGSLLMPSELLPIIDNKKIIYHSFAKPHFFFLKNTTLGNIPVLRFLVKLTDKLILNQYYKIFGWDIYTNSINKYLQREKINLIHFSDTFFFNCDCKKVLTIHDLVPLKFPELQQEETVNIHTRRCNFIKECVDGVITVSENSKKDIRYYLPNIPTQVTYLGSDPNFFVIDKTYFKNTIKKLKSKTLDCIEWKNYYVSLGTIEPRKNYGTLLSAYADLYFNNKIDKKLIIVGGKGWGGTYEKIQNFVCENHLENQIIVLNYVSDKILNLILNGTYSLIYPSLYEGFGLPPLEAMSLGIPVITSNNSSLPEVVGTEQLSFNPTDIEALKNRILELEEKRLYEKMCKNAIEQSKKFSWKNTAEKSMEFYMNIINKN